MTRMYLVPKSRGLVRIKTSAYMSLLPTYDSMEVNARPRDSVVVNIDQQLLVTFHFFIYVFDINEAV